MKMATYNILLVVLALLSFPITVDAFGRRPSNSEVSQSQGRPGPLNTHIQDDPNGRPPQSVPEPSTLLLTATGLALMVMLGRKKYSCGDATGGNASNP
jgi:hypothetical protein